MFQQIERMRCFASFGFVFYMMNAAWRSREPTGPWLSTAAPVVPD
jgi:hypothetical protein